MPSLSGNVKDLYGNNVSRLVRVFHRQSGFLVGQAISNASTGAWSVTCNNTEKHYAIVFDGDPALIDPYWDQVIFASHLSTPNYFVDVKQNTPIHCGGNAGRSSAQSKFSGYSAYFDGSQDMLAFYGSQFAMGSSQAFVVDFWLYLINGGHGGSYSRILLPGYNSTNGSLILSTVASNNPSGLILQRYSGGYANLVSAGTALSNTTWHHVAVGRKADGYWFIGVDGAPYGTPYNTSFDHTQQVVYVGSNNSATESFYGHMEDMRWTVGTDRGMGGTYTVPTSAFVEGPTSGTENALVLDNLTPA